MIGYQVFEITFLGKHSVSKVYPTLSGAMRARHKIHSKYPFYKHIIVEV